MNYSKEEISAAIKLRAQMDNQARLEALNQKTMQELQDMLANIVAEEPDVQPITS